MDLFVERQVVEKMKSGDLKQFLLLFDDNFSDLFKYVRRRVSTDNDADSITREVLVSALNKVQEAPVDQTFLNWLFSLAKQKIFNLAKNSNFKEDFLIEENSEMRQENKIFVERGNKMFSKLSLEEKEILRLKFFEELSDSDIMFVLGKVEGAIGPKIYKALKRAHNFLFGEAEESQGVYFGELSGFMARLRDIENLVVPEASKLTLRLEIEDRINRKDFAIEGEVVEENKVSAEDYAKDMPGSDDPAKIFVKAVEDMRKEEEEILKMEREELEEKEKKLDRIEKWKVAFTFVPLVIVLAVLGMMFLNFDFSKLGGGKDDPNQTDHPFNFPLAECNVEVEYQGFEEEEIAEVEKGVSQMICGVYEVDSIVVSKVSDEEIDVAVDLPDWLVDYNFVKKPTDWRIIQYERERITNSNG